MPHLPKLLTLTLFFIFAYNSSSYAIQRVAPKLGVLEFRGGYAMPLGDYNGIPGLDFVFDDTELVSFDADNVFNEGFALGISYGQIAGGHWLMSIGLDYARNKIKNPILQDIGNFQYSMAFLDDQTYQQYDLSLRGAYLFNNLAHTFWSPFFGLGASAGLSSTSSPGYQTESEFDFGLSLDFGLDYKLWKAAGNRSFVTLSSINSWNFVATGDRISYLQVGGGIKYYFKP